MGFFERFRGKPPTPDEKVVEKNLELKGEPVRMNLIDSYYVTVEAIIQLEGEKWYKDGGKRRIESALSRAETDGTVGIFYGTDSKSKYYVFPTGSVACSQQAGLKKVDQAKALGFYIIIE